MICRCSDAAPLKGLQLEPADSELIEVQVKESSPDFATGQYRVVLQEKETEKILSIWVGHFEGSAIALGLEEAWTPRPMTHDLAMSVFREIGITVTRVVITHLKENTFYAQLYLDFNGHELVMDSRPSDAIALAVRQKSPVFVSKALSGKMADEIDELFERMQPKDTVH